MAYEYDEDTMSGALDMALPIISALEDWQKKIVGEIGKEKKKFEEPILGEELQNLFNDVVGKNSEELISKLTPDFKQKESDLRTLWENTLDEKEIGDTQKSIAKDYFEAKIDFIVHEIALKNNVRVDGRGFDQVRGLYAQAGRFSPILHGTGIFYRGETHVFSALTLGGPENATLLDGMEVRGTKRFSHHYNFPAYSAGETGRFGGINRREMGHGFLAEKALYPVIPSKEQFPYTIRVVSESMASNGSTSQASICASSLALMDGGVPIKSPVAGIAMGLMLSETKSASGGMDYKILTDIQGPEDHYGDMDFKVAGTREGITAIQLDIKVGGIPPQILKEALINAKKARVQILDVIEKEIPTPRKDISPNAPKILMTKVQVDQIGLVIGSGGKTIKGIRDATGSEITVEDDGSVYVTGKGDSAERALQMILDLTREYKEGEILEGEVVKILEIGAVVKLSANADGLVHISEIAPFRIARVSDFLKEGMRVPVKVIAVDKERGRISLSIKEANRDFIKPPTTPEAPKA